MCHRRFQIRDRAGLGVFQKNLARPHYDLESDMISFHAVHPKWCGPIMCNKDGTFVGGSNKPNGVWHFSDDQRRIILKWHHWPTETLNVSEEGFQNDSTRLVRSAAQFLGFWPGFDPSRTCFAALREKSLSVASVWGDSVSFRVTDIAFSGENVQIKHDGRNFDWTLNSKHGKAKWFLGIPRIEHPCALHVPLFYFDCAHRTPPKRIAQKRFGVSFVARNIWCGNLSQRRLDLAIALSKWFPVAVPNHLRPHFPSGSKAEFYDVADKCALLEQFTFNLCFENTSAHGYLTEKLFDALYAGAVPLYAGDPYASDYVRTEGYIDCLHLSDGEVVERVAALEKSEYCSFVESERLNLCSVTTFEMAERISAFLARIAKSDCRT